MVDSVYVHVLHDQVGTCADPPHLDIWTFGHFTAPCKRWWVARKKLSDGYYHVSSYRGSN